MTDQVLLHPQMVSHIRGEDLNREDPGSGYIIGRRKEDLLRRFERFSNGPERLEISPDHWRNGARSLVEATFSDQLGAFDRLKKEDSICSFLDRLREGLSEQL